MQLFILLLVALPAAIVSSELEARRKKRVGDTELPYAWGYFQGVSGLLLGCWALVLAMFADDSGILVLAGIVWAPSGYFVIKRRKWAWVLHTIASLNPLWWIVNTIYGRNRWAEFDLDESIAGGTRPSIVPHQRGPQDSAPAESAQENQKAKGAEEEIQTVGNDEKIAASMAESTPLAKESIAPDPHGSSSPPANEEAKSDHRMRPFRTLRSRLVLAAVTLSAVAIAGIATFRGSSRHSSTDAATNSRLPNSSTPREIASRAQAATVQLKGLDLNGNLMGQGTGFFLSTDGFIATNLHVLREAQSVQVVTLTGEIYDVVYYVTADPRRDIAILKIPIDDARPLPLAADDSLQVGDPVFVMGNPLGQVGTFSDGLVSARRTLEGVSWLQITAPISPGSSGGPVLNSRGEVIGIATLMLTGGQNLNYAVPVRFVRPLIATNETPRRYAINLLPSATAGLTSSTARNRSGAAPSARTRSVRAPRSDMIASSFFSYDSSMVGTSSTPIGEIQRHNLRAGAKWEYDLTLVIGREYGIVAFCDADCTDLDLTLVNSNGLPVLADTEENDYPALFFKAPASGTFTLTVIMSACSNEPCQYGVRLYRF